MSYVQERFAPKVLGVNSTTIVQASSVGGFLAKTSGTITLTAFDGTVIVSAVPVTAGFFTPMPFFIGPNGYTVVLAGGASGTLAA